MGRDRGNGGSSHDRDADQDKQAAKEHYEKEAQRLAEERAAEENNEG